MTLNVGYSVMGSQFCSMTTVQGVLVPFFFRVKKLVVSTLQLHRFYTLHQMNLIYG